MYKVVSEGTKELSEKLKKMGDSLGSLEMMEFLGNKIQQTLNTITNENLTSVEDTEISDYASNHKKKVSLNEVELSNSTMADLSGLSSETLLNYPNGFSIAKAVEYGTGVVGASSSSSSIASEYGWQYDINQHGTKGWYYKKDGNIYWSKGFEGRLIFYKTAKVIEDKAGKWIVEYLKSKGA